MKKLIYKKTMTRLVYAWVLLFSLLILLIVNLHHLSGYLNEDDRINKEQLRLVEFTYKTELVGHNLTNSVRFFAAIFDPTMLANYWDELQKIRGANDYIIYLKNLHGSKEELQYIIQAKKLADAIRENEIKSIKLILAAYQINNVTIPSEINDYSLSEEEISLPPAEKIKMAQKLLQIPAYLESKEKIFLLIKKTREAIVKRSHQYSQVIEKHISYTMLYVKLIAYLALTLVIIIVWIRALAIRKLLH